MTNKDTNLIGINTQWGIEEDDENLVRRHTQEIPQWHLDRLKEERNNSLSQREGDFMRVASIPVVVVEKWMREGFDIMSDRNITGKDILKRLKNENLDAFITTDKSI